MTLFEPILVGLTQLRANKLRSLLSLVGILIAVGAVTGIVSIGDGLQKYITGEFDQMGGYTLIWSWAPNQSYRNDQGRWVQRNWEEYLTERDIEAIKAETDKVEFITPNIGAGGWEVAHKGVSTTTNVTFTGTEYLATENMQIAQGRFLTAYDILQRAKVCVLGSKLAEDLFGAGMNPINREVSIRGTRFTVVGVTAEKTFFDNNYNERLMAPVTTGQARYTGDDHYGFINVKVKTPGDVDEVVAAMKRVYKRLHRHGEDFNIQTGQEAIAQITNVLMIMKIIAGGIAGISLLVGGIGIMNIMLVSVAERTREIGIRKALGATRTNILQQFIVEAVVLCLFGGMCGVLFGYVLGTGLALIITKTSGMAFISVISPKMAFIAVGFSLSVGLTFGVYPAWSASRLEPVEALRSD